MAHLNSISASIYADLAFGVHVADLTAINAAIADGSIAATDFEAAFAASEVALGAAPTPLTGEFRRITNIREFPSVGTPANIVNVPVYGQKSSSQIQGQSDAPSLEVQLNFVADDWADATNYLGELVGNGTQYPFRVALMSSEPTSYLSTVGGIGSVLNSSYYFVGKIEALSVSPQLSDAVTATLTLSTQSDFYGAYTL